MPQITLRILTVLTPTGPVARVTDLTDWSQGPGARADYALLLTGAKLGSVQAQDVVLEPMAYDPALFQSGANPAGTVDVPLPGDGVFRFTATAVYSAGAADAEPATTDGYAFNDQFLQAALARLNLRYLEAGTQKRAALLEEYLHTDLLITGGSRQYELGFYADAATSLTAAEHLVGRSLPGFAQSLPALLTNADA
ncbi:hypothetical protein [Hymenobacter siberiensis]|uniref:hypothetical protein n=1 Tax=Hymenobacter siberiensis TaxID=2848396 RepID=UPI001C1DFA60|nr:hypothetical protein [Hymenobacter siberiensis]